MTLLAVENLAVAYEGKGGAFRAVEDVSFEIARGETLGLVGESGCGKSTIGRSVLRLVPSCAGSIHLAGTDITRLGERALKPFRRRIQMVFQDPAGSLNPRQTVGTLLDLPLRAHGISDRQERRQRITSVLDAVGLPQMATKRFPHEFSGGQKQRIGIARALVLKPELLVLDEPVSALDVSIQNQVLNLLSDLKAEFGLSYLFISHDLSIVRYFTDRVIVMYRGKIVETGRPDTVWATPQHAYTKTLLDAVPQRG